MPDLVQEFTASVIAGIDNIAGVVMDDMLSNAPTSDTEEAISLAQTATLVEQGVVEAKIGIDLDKAPEALAYEFGSGVHGAKGEKYPIVPVNKKWLAFLWDKADPERHIMLPDGRVLFKKVMHPGVAAKPYIRPAIEKAKKMLPQLLGRELIEGLDIYFRNYRSG